MSEFRIEKIRRQVTVKLAGGAVLAGELFLQPTARYRTGPQTPGDLLNEGEPFIPLSTPDGALVLLAKSHIDEVEFEAVPADTPIDGASEADVEIVFDGGGATSGQLRMESRLERPRLLDFLNVEHERFLTLRTADGLRLINRSRIAQVRPRA